ncbi:unnamed protein product [Lymnaea stagnalis]|uniref:Uncharacterized protein n=1 Tax=Lymnaea stagnalis TaxID=6523 RepID=A0AAV2HGI2_LYMST
MADGTTRTSSPYPGKRNSEPWHNVEGCACPDLSSCAARNPRVFQLNNERLSPSNVVCGSHGYIPKLSEARSLGSSAGAYRNSEPTILIHPASTDVDPTQGWSDIRSRYTNGIVFLKRVPKGDGSTGEYFYEEQTDPQLDRARRASLSKVSYVPSGNMNEYYNYLTSPKKTKVELPKLDTASDSPTPTKSCPGLTLGPSRNKRSRLSLGEIAISNFNKRIDIGSESHESAPESSMESKGSHESASNPQHSKYRSTWMKFKNVFTTSRSSHSSGSQSKTGKSMSVVEERHRRRGRHVDSRWKRFVSVFTGFRSLPETKLSSHSLDCPKCSSSVPSGLDLAEKKCPYEKCNSVDVESGIGLTDMNISRVSLINEKVTDPVENFHTLDRPKSLRLPTHAQSVPEELISLRNFNQIFKNPEQANEPINPLDVSILPRRYRKRCDPIDASSLSLPQSKKDFRTYIFQTGGLNSPGEMRSRMLPREINTPPGQMASPCSSDGHFYSRRFRNLSPLPETCIGGCQKTCGSRSPSLTADADNVSEKSVYLTPSHLNADKDLFFELTGYSNEIGRDIVARDRSLSNDRLSFIKMPFFDLCSVRKISSETNLSTKCSRIDANDLPLGNRGNKNCSAHNDCCITFDIKSAQTDSSSSINNELSWNKNGNSQPTLSHLTTNSPMEASTRAAINHLTIDHRQIALSSDSVYYDSLSAVGTPCQKSPQDLNGLFTEKEEPSFAIVEPSPDRSPSSRLDEVNTRPGSSGKNSLFSELLSTPYVSRAPTPTPSETKQSSPFASRTPSPCLFWQSSPREISNSSSSPHLAKPTPTRKDWPNDALGLAPSLLPPQVTHLASSSLTKETRFAFRPALQDNGPTFAPTAKSNCLTFTSTTKDNRFEFTPVTKDSCLVFTPSSTDNCLAFTPTTKDNCVALKPTTDESLTFTPILKDNGLALSTPTQECYRLLSSNEGRSQHETPRASPNSSLTEHDSLVSGPDHAECPTTTAASPRGSRNPTPTRSFSTPSPSFDKTPGSYVLPEESYRANVSRLPRFARRASQGTPVPYVQSQDVVQAKMAGEKNGPLRESSMEVTYAPRSMEVTYVPSSMEVTYVPSSMEVTYVPYTQNVADSLETDDMSSPCDSLV